MRRRHRNASLRRSRGVTLIELVVVIVLMAIIVGTLIYFAMPVRQAVDITARAELTDTADGALQRIGRDVRLALPNSVRTGCGSLCVEFIPVLTAGRYRANSSGAGCDTAGDAAGSDELTFDLSDSCFKSIGALPKTAPIAANQDFLVLNNYGSGFAGQDAYATAAPVNRALVSQADPQGVPVVRERINFVPPNNFASAFSRTLHDSPGRRFFIVTTPVTYACDLGTGELRRHSGYAYGGVYTDVVGRLIANNVTGCVFDYVNNGVGAQVGLLTLRLTLSRGVSSGQTETVTLHHAIHVNNVP